MSNAPSSVGRLGAWGLAVLLPACSGDLLGAPRQDTVPRPIHATEAEIAADPCKHGDLPRCADRCMERRDAASCNTVGVLLEYGADTDFAAAASYYGRACAASYAPGCTGLGWLHLLGRGARKDPVLAIALFTRAYDGYRLACAEGHLESCVAAADFLIDGRGVAHDDAAALALLDGACDRGERRACERAKTLR